MPQELNIQTSQIDSKELNSELEKAKKGQSIKESVHWDKIFFNTHKQYRFYYMSEVDLNKLILDDRILVREKDASLINRLTPQIRSEGLIEPLTVLDLSNNKFLLLAGQHRYHVCKNLGISHVPAKIYLNLDFAEQLTLGYMSNEVRKDPPAGRRYGALHEIFNETKRKLESKLNYSPSESEVIDKMYMTTMPHVAKFKIKEIVIGIITDDLIHDSDSLVGKHKFISMRQVPKRKIISKISNRHGTKEFPLLTSQNAFYGLNHLVRTSAVTLEEEKIGKNFRKNEYENVKMFFDLLISKYILHWVDQPGLPLDCAMSVCRRHVFESLCKLVSVTLRDKDFDIKTKEGNKAPLFTDRKIPWTEIFEQIKHFFTPEFLTDPTISQERSMDVLWNRVEYYTIVKPGIMPSF